MIAYPVALCDAQGEAWLTETRDAGTTRLATASDRRCRRVGTTTLDQFAHDVALERLDLVKVDIEGALKDLCYALYRSTNRGLTFLEDLPVGGAFFNAICLPVEWKMEASLSWACLQNVIARRAP